MVTVTARAVTVISPGPYPTRTGGEHEKAGEEEG